MKPFPISVVPIVDENINVTAILICLLVDWLAMMPALHCVLSCNQGPAAWDVESAWDKIFCHSIGLPFVEQASFESRAHLITVAFQQMFLQRRCTVVVKYLAGSAIKRIARIWIHKLHANSDGQLLTSLAQCILASRFDMPPPVFPAPCTKNITGFHCATWKIPYGFRSLFPAFPCWIPLINGIPHPDPLLIVPYCDFANIRSCATFEALWHGLM